MSELRVDNIVSEDGTSAPVYSKGMTVGAGQTFTVAGDVAFNSGATVTGVVTFTEANLQANLTVDSINSTGIVTASVFKGDGGQLTGIDSTALVDGNGATKVQANESGVVVTGITTVGTGGIVIGGVTQTMGVGHTVLGGARNTYTENARNYDARTFLSSGTLVVQEPIVVDFCIIGGGGGGATHNTTNGNGGGGAGQVVVGRGVTFPAGTYQIEVGEGAAHTGDHSQGGGGGRRGEDSWILGPDYPTLGIGYTALGGGGGQSTGQPGTDMPIHDGGSGGGRCSGNNPRFYAIGDTYMTNTMPISDFNNDPYRNSGIIKGYGNPGGNGVGWSGGGGGGAGQVGYAGQDPGPPTCGNGGYGIILPWSYGVQEYLAGGGGGGGNSSETCGDGTYGGGRGTGSTGSFPHTSYPYTQLTAFPYGMGDVDAKQGTGSGGGAGSYWHVPSAGHVGGGGRGGSGRVVIRWETN
tara:strand:+ start:532 stop:1929 length:1398 start_codon:yes stop_codon:yes gene_type:complete